MTTADGPAESSYSRTLSDSECYELLAVATVGRIGFVSPAGVQIYPLDFRIGAGPRLFMKTSPHGTVAELAEHAASVALEVDYHASDFGIAWSVLMHGTLSLLDDVGRAAYADLPLQPVPWPGPASTVTIQFVPETISGRGLRRP